MGKNKWDRHVKSIAETKTEKLLTEQNATDFTVVIPDEIYQQCMWWVNKSDYEVSWFGNVVFDEKKKEFTVKKVTLLEQENTGSETEIKAESLCQAMFELKDEEGELKWWGHSHVNMNVFWSGQDMHTIRELGRQGWILATVFNQKEETRSAYLQSVNILGNEHDFFVDNIRTVVPRYLSDEEVSKWDAMYKEKVKEKSVTVYPQTGNFDAWDDYDDLAKDFWKKREKHSKNEAEVYEAKNYSWNDCVNKFGASQEFWSAYSEVAHKLAGYEDHMGFGFVYSCDVNDVEEEFAEAFDFDIEHHFLSLTDGGVIYE